MLYPDGQEIRIGDEMELWPGNEGTVVANIDSGEFSMEFPKKDWDYLKSGILVLSNAAGLIQYKDPEQTFRLIRRASSA